MQIHMRICDRDRAKHWEIVCARERSEIEWVLMRGYREMEDREHGIRERWCRDESRISSVKICFWGDMRGEVRRMRVAFNFSTSIEFTFTARYLPFTSTLVSQARAEILTLRWHSFRSEIYQQYKDDRTRKKDFWSRLYEEDMQDEKSSLQRHNREINNADFPSQKQRNITAQHSAKKTHKEIKLQEFTRRKRRRKMHIIHLNPISTNILTLHTQRQKLHTGISYLSHTQERIGKK